MNPSTHSQQNQAGIGSYAFVHSAWMFTNHLFSGLLENSFGFYFRAVY